MASLIGRRLAGLVVVLFVTSIISFALLRVAPGDPARQVLGPTASAAAVQDLRKQMGLDRSIPDQYGTYVSGLAHGDFGISWRTRQSVGSELANRIPATLELALYASLLALLIAVPIGVLAARHARFDRLSRWGSVVGLGTPSFFLGLILILFFFTDLKLAPAPFGRLDAVYTPPPEVTGLYTIDALLAGQFSTFVNALEHLALPVITLALPLAAFLSRIVRRSTADVLRLDFIRTARAKGASERRILFRHALPNAMLPVITLSALAFGDLLAGALLVEAVYSWPGVGGWVASSILAQDYAPVQGAIIVAAAAYCLLNLLADVAYSVADPRVRAATA
jgi:peptide/nickel transport system permease protein